MDSPQPPVPVPAPEATPAPPPSVPKRRARGKIARMKPPLRDKINHLLDEGIPYSQIVTNLETEAPDLTLMDISRWFQSGHQDWLKNQLWLDETRSRLDMAIDVIAEHEGSNVHLANLHVAATHLIQDLIQRGHTLLADHPDQYVDIINSIARIGHEALNFQKYREACAQAREALSPLRDSHRKLTDEETRAIADKVDRILGFK